MFFFLKNIENENGKFKYIGTDEKLIRVKNQNLKTVSILKFLAKNQIYFVYHKYVTENREVDLRSYLKPDEDSFYEAYSNMNFNKVLSEIEPKIRCNDKNVVNLLKQAFIYYELSLYENSYAILVRLSKYAKSKNKCLVHFICEYNLKMLPGLLHNSYDKKDRDKVISICEDVDLNDLICDFQSKNVSKDIIYLLCWIKDDKYLYSKQNVISKILDGARKNYEYDQQGKTIRFSMPSLISRLETFLGEFVKINFGYFFFNTQYNNDFESIIHSIAETIIAMYQLSTKNKQIEFVPEWLINFLFQYSKPEKLNQLIRKYKVNQIALNKNKLGLKLKFINDLKNLSNSKAALLNFFKDKELKRFSVHFDSNLTKFVNNGIIFTHYLDLTKDEFNTALKYLLRIFSLKETRNSSSDTFKYLFNLIEVKKQDLSESNINSLVKLKNTFTNKSIDFSFDFYNLYNLSQLKKEKETFINEKVEYYKEHMNCSHTNYDELYEIFPLCNEPQKNRFIKIVNEKLKSKFDERIFH